MDLSKNGHFLLQHLLKLKINNLNNPPGGKTRTKLDQESQVISPHLWESNLCFFHPKKWETKKKQKRKHTVHVIGGRRLNRTEPAVSYGFNPRGKPSSRWKRQVNGTCMRSWKVSLASRVGKITETKSNKPTCRGGPSKGGIGIGGFTKNCTPRNHIYAHILENTSCIWLLN